MDSFFPLSVIYFALSYCSCCQQSTAHYVFILDATGRRRGWRFPVISQLLDTWKTLLLIVSSNNSGWKKKSRKMGKTGLGEWLFSVPEQQGVNERFM